jgi:hypothetical protein
MAEESGSLAFDGQTIRYRSPAYGDWDVDLDDVRLIGEYTTQDGPFADDFFICFITGADHWYRASFYAEGEADCLRGVAERLGDKLTHTLYGSADFASNLMWPPVLAGEPMLEFTKVKRKNMFSLEWLLFGRWVVEQSLTDRVTGSFSDE